MRLAALFLLAAPVFAGTMTLAECSVFTDGAFNPVVRSSTACALDRLSDMGNPSDLWAASGVSEFIPEDPTFEAAFVATAYSVTLSYVDGGISEEWLATGLASVASRLVTNGPQRAGLIELSVSMGGGTINGLSNGDWAIGNLSGLFFGDGSGGVCSGPTLEENCQIDRVIFPFILGSGFDVSLNALAFSCCGLSSSTSEAATGVGVNFRLTELDGTSVQMHAVPEPGTLWLFGSILCALAFKLRHASRRKSSLQHRL